MIHNSRIDLAWLPWRLWRVECDRRQWWGARLFQLSEAGYEGGAS